MAGRIIKVFIVLAALAVAVPVALMFLMPFRVAVAGFANKRLGGEEICAELMRGDYAAANARIALKSRKREFSFLDSIVWLGGRGGAPFRYVEASPLFTDIPQGLGKPESCTPQAGHNLSGFTMSTEIFLAYPAHHVRVGMWYTYYLYFPRLQSIQIYPPEPRAPGAGPDDFMARMAGFKAALDNPPAVENSTGPASPAAYPGLKEPALTAKGFISRYGCYFPLQPGYEAASRMHETIKGAERVMIYPSQGGSEVWTSFDKVAPPAVAVVISPLDKAAAGAADFAQKNERSEEELMAAANRQPLTAKYGWGGGPGFRTFLHEPREIRVRLYGEKRLYAFSSAHWETLRYVLQGFEETADHRHRFNYRR